MTNESFLAKAIECASSGTPCSSAMFLSGNPFEPLRAGTTAQSEWGCVGGESGIQVDSSPWLCTGSTPPVVRGVVYVRALMAANIEIADSPRSTPALTERTLIIWDSPGDPPGHAEQVYLWNGYGESDSVHSVLQYVEAHSERLRGKYLSWIHELGEQPIEGTGLIDALILEEGFSYWWMTLLVEKSLWKSPAITDAIRVLALEEIVEQRTPGTVLLVSANRQLHSGSGVMSTLGITYGGRKVSTGERID